MLTWEAWKHWRNGIWKRTFVLLLSKVAQSLNLGLNPELKCWPCTGFAMCSILISFPVWLPWPPCLSGFHSWGRRGSEGIAERFFSFSSIPFLPQIRYEGAPASLCSPSSLKITWLPKFNILNLSPFPKTSSLGCFGVSVSVVDGNVLKMHKSIVLCLWMFPSRRFPGKWLKEVS